MIIKDKNTKKLLQKEYLYHVSSEITNKVKTKTISHVTVIEKDSSICLHFDDGEELIILIGSE